MMTTSENDRDYVDEVRYRGGSPMTSRMWLFLAVVVFIGIGVAVVIEHFQKDIQSDATSLAAHAEHLASDGLGASHSEHTRTTDGQAVNGFSYGNGFQITWQSNTAPNAATPLDVLEAVQSRLLHMQKTKLGGDEVARALWDVGKAIESLSGPLKDGGKSGGGAGFIQPNESN